MTKQKSKKLSSIWAGRHPFEQLDLPITKSEKNRQISHWIKGGLKCVEKVEVCPFSQLA